MKIADHREEELKDHQAFAVYGTDRFMSGWGHAEGGYSVAIWYCYSKDLDKVEEWVSNRGDMQWIGAGNYHVIEKATENYHLLKEKAAGRPVKHVSLYSIDEGHPALVEKLEGENHD